MDIKLHKNKNVCKHIYCGDVQRNWGSFSEEILKHGSHFCQKNPLKWSHFTMLQKTTKSTVFEVVGIGFRLSATHPVKNVFKYSPPGVQHQYQCFISTTDFCKMQVDLVLVTKIKKLLKSCTLCILPVKEM